MKRIRVVGCGAFNRGDDEAGLRAAEALRGLLPPPVEVLQETAGGSRLLDWCQGVDKLVLIDAALATPQFPAGSQARLAYPAQRDQLLATGIRCTHALSLTDALRLAETLGQLPGEVVLFLLAASHFQPGTGLSDALRPAVVRLVEAISREIAPAANIGKPSSRSCCNEP